MVEVLASPGLASPWSSQEIAPNSQFITKGSSVKTMKFLSLDHLANYWGSVDADSQSNFPPHSPTLKRLRTSSVSGNMSHVHLPMNRSHSKGFLCYPPKPHSLHQATLPSSSIVSPAMESTYSSDGSVYDELPHGYIYQPSHSFTTAPYAGMANTALMSDFDWTAKNLSFVSEVEDTPPLSSSYELMDLPKDEPPTWDNTPYQTQMPLMSISNDNNAGLQPLNPQFQECPTSWTSWPINIEDCMQPFQENVDQSATYPDHSTNWRQEVDYPMIQDYKAFQMPITSDPQPIIHQESAHNSTYTLSSTRTTTSLQDQLPRTISNYMAPHPETTNIQQPHPHLITGASDHQQHPQHPTQGALRQYTPESLSQPDSPIQSQPQIQSRPPNILKATLHYTDSRNAFLIDCKRRGLSYKEIKRMGGFKEAESTLRGRFRTLTKSKEQRVRKPKWLQRDVSYHPAPAQGNKGNG